MTPATVPTRRSWLRWVLAGVVAVGVLGAAVGVPLIVYRDLLFAPPGKTGKYVTDLERLLAPTREAPGDDAWPIWLEAVTLRKKVEDGLWLEGGQPVSRYPGPTYAILTQPPAKDDPPEWVGQEIGRIRSMVERARDAGLYELMDRLVATRRVRRPIPAGVLLGQARMEELGGARALVRLSGARMRLAAERGDWRDWLRAFEGSLALGRLCASQHSAIDHLVGYAVWSSALGCLRTDVELFHPPPEVLSGANAAIDRQLPIGAPLTLVEGERLQLLDMVEATYSDDGHGDGWARPAELPSDSPEAQELRSWPRVVSNAIGMRMATKKQTIESHESGFAALRKAFAAPRHARDAIMAANPLVVPERPRMLQIEILLPALLQAAAAHDNIQTEIGATRIVMALELYRAASGRYPEKLSDLVPGTLAELPVDRVSEKPWGYKLRTPDATDSRGFLLYTLGDDQQDNDGLERPDPDQAKALGIHAEPGFDYVFNTQPYRSPRPAVGPPRTQDD